MKVKQLKITKDMKVSEFMDQLDNSGVLGAGRVAKATNIIADSFNDSDTKVFLSLAGPMIPGGLRTIVRDLIEAGYVNLIVSSGANMTHDLVEAFGGNHYSGLSEDDETLAESGIGRIGDVFTKSDDFEVFEEEIHKVFSIINKKYKVISHKDFLKEIGLVIDADDSILTTAAKNDVPIYAPGLIDCMIGLQLWIYCQDHDFTLSSVADMADLSDFVYNSKKVTAVMLGGGLPKHYTLASNILTGGIDAGVQITLDRSEGGSLSGAPLEEAKSWAKAKAGSNLVTVVGDATVMFPLIIAAALDKVDR